MITKVAMAQLLKTLRARNLLTQQQLSDDTGIPKGTLKMWEMGRNLPNTTHMRILTEYYKTDEIIKVYETLKSDWKL